jgi:hypothetical protein
MTVWVKRSIANDGDDHTIYVYYGNPNAGREDNGDATFLFFDDFNDNSLDPNKWVKVLTGGTVDVLEQNQDLEIKSDGTYRAYARSKNTFAAPYILEAKARKSGNIEIACHWDGTTKTVASYEIYNGYYAPMYKSWDSPTRFALSKWKSGTLTELAYYNIALDTNWHLYKVVAKTNGIDVCYNGSLILSTTDTTFTSGYIGLSAVQTPAAINAYYDDVRVRKYVSPEPTTSVGEEEQYGG